MDHKGISTILNISKPPISRKSVSYRKYRAIELAEFASDNESTITFYSEEMPLDDLVRYYNDSIRAAVDKHAPVQTKVVTLRPSTQWYSQELHAVKKDKRKAERVWRRTKLEVHRHIFKEKCNASSRLLFQNKHDLYSTNIIECGNDTKILYKLTNKLMGKKSGCRFDD